MSKDKIKDILVVLGGIIIILAILLSALTLIRRYNSDIDVAISKMEKENPINKILGINQLPYEAPIIGDIKQPDGYGVERPITEQPGIATESEVKDLSSIDFGGMEAIQYDIPGDFDKEEKEAAAKALKKEIDNRYVCNIEWYDDWELSQSEYETLIIACGRIQETELNKAEEGRYTVISNVPNSDALIEAGVPYAYGADEHGFMDIWCDMIIQDNTAGTEVQEIRHYKLGYEENYLKFY